MLDLVLATHASSKPVCVQECRLPRVVDTTDRLRTFRVMTTIVRLPDEFDAQHGVVRLSCPTPVRPERVDSATLDPVEPHTQFFLDASPGYQRGEGSEQGVPNRLEIVADGAGDY